MSLESAQAFVARLREDAQFRWSLGECRDQLITAFDDRVCPL